AAILQIKFFFREVLSFGDILTRLLFQPVDFLVGSLLFLMGFLMLANIFQFYIVSLYLMFRGKLTSRSNILLQLIIFVVMFLGLFRFAFWLTLFACLFAGAFALFTTDFRDNQGMYSNERG